MHWKFVNENVNIIILRQGGNISHGAEQNNYWWNISSEPDSQPHPPVKDVNLFHGEIIMILYKYFLSAQNISKTDENIFIWCRENRLWCCRVIFFKIKFPLDPILFTNTSNNQTFYCIDPLLKYLILLSPFDQL